MQDKITIADAPDCLNTNDKAMWVLGYEAAIEARGQCLHQIQEPEADIWPCVNIDVDESGKITNAKLYSPGLPAGNHDVYPVRVPYMDEHTEAWHACVDELEKAVPGFMSLGNMNGIECAIAAIRGLSERAKHQEPAAAEQAAWHAGLDEGRAQAAGSVSNATFQAAPAAVAVPATFHATQLATFSAAAPVVLPEPVAYSLGLAKYAHSSNIIAANEFTPDAEHADEWENLYTEQQVRALLVQKLAIMPKGESAAAQLRAMATNYPPGHSWDKLDAKACIRGALEIEALHAQLATATGLPAQAVADEVHCVCGASWLRHGVNNYEMTDTPRKAQADARDALTPAARDVLAERQRQVSVEGRTPERDDRYSPGELLMAADSYISWNCGEYEPGTVPINWPWKLDWFKPTTKRRNLEKAGALILAEIERIDRAAIAAAKGE